MAPLALKIRNVSSLTFEEKLCAWVKLWNISTAYQGLATSWDIVVKEEQETQSTWLERKKK